MTPHDVEAIPPDRPVLIAGPTASGKSALALKIAERGGRIVNADAMQVFADWRILTARPGPAEIARAPHALYGHVRWETPYSVGHWLRDVVPLLTDGPRPIVVGGTGLFFRALTEGLADIPPVPDAVRAEAAARLDGIGLEAMAAELSADVRADIDTANPMRVLRAWTVARHTGRSIRDWQAATPPPPLVIRDTAAIVLEAPRDWLAERIARRFDAMLRQGVIDEVRAMLPRWEVASNAAQAIGARELVSYLAGDLTLDEARDAAVVATRRYAKRQRTWFRARMRGWSRIDATVL
ncbi:tRNA (adenosine(37)-N6)-dimethylallyltransferase MiaA [Jannaschia sp. LMIT008]|uniref:tRNA (adenosine(37)-N6)-dimethylallyltransferase MiaA n=1 Tax=Jannaschia maritima TaxID=3032585 RepID=UPI0028111552|nr:tRNA (adenosine(37)-N6)-dimethylallyltransferase MiaA [Jannaschia sp. LMIT008]